MNCKRFIQLGILSVFLVLSGCAGYYSPNGYDYDSGSYYYAPSYDNYGYSYPGFHAGGDFDGGWLRGGQDRDLGMGHDRDLGRGFGGVERGGGSRGEHGGGYER